MKPYIQEHFAISMHALLIVLLLCGVAWYVDRTHTAIELLLSERIHANQELLAHLMEITDRNGIDDKAPHIVSDCQRRPEFEDLLSRLGSLPKKDLVLVQQLFESCGDFYAEQKALMVWRIEEIFTLLEGDLDVLGTIRDLTEDEEEFRKWKSVVELEKTRSEHLFEQTNLQEKIISALIAGVPSGEITELVRDAQAVNESLTVIDQQIDLERMALLE
jgi:hypothetical protein